jgi:predicted AAA+ superfamily ATPase
MNNSSLKDLWAFHALLKDPVISLVEKVENNDDSSLKEEKQSALMALLIEKAEILGLSGNLLSAYLIHLLAQEALPLSPVMEKGKAAGPSLKKVLVHDLTILWPYVHPFSSSLPALLSRYEPTQPHHRKNEEALSAALQQAATPEEGVQALLAHYEHFGAGVFSEFEAFSLDETGALVGIPDFPLYDDRDLIGYESQKEALLHNTALFVEGRDANNVLLTGERGTGKSTVVKSLVRRFGDKGLRLVQMKRAQISYLSRILTLLSKEKHFHFILFLDDLSFEEGEKEYQELKSAMEGSVTPQPSNVLLYVTSNRRHLIKENWSDRSDEEEAIYRDDHTSEALSLSDRFGLILHYGKLPQETYLAIIAHELHRYGIDLPPETLRVEAVRWEMEHSGRNGRIAHQFVTWYRGQFENSKDKNL